MLLGLTTVFAMAAAADGSPAEAAPEALEWIPRVAPPCEPVERVGTAEAAEAAEVVVPDADTAALIPIPTFDACVGKIQPGARMTAPAGCTFNFVFRDASNTYIGTAGHCTAVGNRVSASGVGEFGTTVMSVNGGLGNDFALVRVDAAKLGLVDARMCSWGGPVGAHSGSTPIGSRVLEYGWGVATQFTPHTRTRVHLSFSQSSSSASWNGVGSGGDSGAPLLTEDQRAWAIHTHGVTPVAGVVLESGTYIQRALTMAGNAGFPVTLATFP